MNRVAVITDIHANTRSRSTGHPSSTAAAPQAFVRDLPLDLRFELGGRRIRLVHGSPRKVNEYLFEDKPARTFEASFAVLATTGESVGATIERVPYDAAAVAREIRETGLPDELADKLVAAA